MWRDGRSDKAVSGLRQVGHTTGSIRPAFSAAFIRGPKRRLSRRVTPSESSRSRTASVVQWTSGGYVVATQWIAHLALDFSSGSALDSTLRIPMSRRTAPFSGIVFFVFNNCGVEGQSDCLFGKGCYVSDECVGHGADVWLGAPTGVLDPKLVEGILLLFGEAPGQ